MSSFSHIDQIKAVWDAYQGGDEYVFGEAVGKLAVSVGADLLGKIVGGGAAGLVMSLKSGAKAASNAADAAGDASRASRGLDACPAGAMSFSADTRVLMAEGTRKRIDQIREGDQVAAADPETGETGGRAVEATWPHRDDLITLRTSAGQIVTTEDHPYWNATDSAWEQIQQFNHGDQLLTPDGNRVTVLALDWTTRTDAPAYNLTVNDLHTYNVLTTNDTPVLVHNCRRGNQATRDHIDEVRDEFMSNNPGWVHEAGGTDMVTGRNLPEEYLPSLTGGRRGSSYPDLTFRGPNGGRIRVNTVDTYADGSMTAREAANLRRIFEQTGEPITAIPNLALSRGDVDGLCTRL